MIFILSLEITELVESAIIKSGQAASPLIAHLFFVGDMEL